MDLAFLGTFWAGTSRVSDVANIVPRKLKARGPHSDSICADSHADSHDVPDGHQACTTMTLDGDAYSRYSDIDCPDSTYILTAFQTAIR